MFVVCRKIEVTLKCHEKLSYNSRLNVLSFTIFVGQNILSPKISIGLNFSYMPEFLSPLIDQIFKI